MRDTVPPGVSAPALLLTTDKITVSHRSRDAYVYVRQSTPTQMIQHTESLARQYELRERAVALGWPGHQVVVIDADLGRSGAQTDGRLGFKELVADVGLGKVGIVLGIEVSRLARNNADWYQLLDLCAITDTLIADADGVYHPAEFNDRLVLGLKGTMSEAELHLIKSRLTAGLKHKAAKGELRQGLPVGLDYDEDNRVVMTPDEAVREAISTVFRRFEELGSARQVLIRLREDEVLLPRRANGSRRITWAAATYPAVHDFLTNPAYAGAFVFGRSRTEKRVDPITGAVHARVQLVPREQWEVLIPDHHPGYITWETYESNTARLRGNWRRPRELAGGAVREGRALLQGLLRCGRCGRIMQTGYSGAKGNCPRYVCARAKQLYAGEHVCQSIGGIRLENTVMDEMFDVLAPAALTATAQALAEADANYQRDLAVFELAVERARYEADRARRQFDNVEPENRLVARTLETALESKLAAVRAAENNLAAQRARRPVALTEAEAKSNNALPLNDYGVEGIHALEYKVTPPKDGRYTYYPDTSEVPEASAARTLGASFKILAEVEFTKATQGVIVSQGSRFGGYTLFVKDGQLNFVYNFLGIAPEQKLSCPAPVSGKHVVGVDFAKSSISEKLEVLGTMTLYIDDKAVAKADFRTQSGHYALCGEGVAVGRDSADPVSTEYSPGFSFTGGRISKVTYDVGDDAYVDLERRLGAILARD
jgi:DNA invertase Pin-like site-specific DNA recombinase